MKNEIDLDALLKEMALHHQPQLPSATLIWWRAQVARKLGEKHHIERPLVAMRVAAAVTCMAILVILIAISWGQFQVVVRENRWFVLPPLAVTVSFAVAWLVSLRTKSNKFPGSSSLDSTPG